MQDVGGGKVAGEPAAPGRHVRPQGGPGGRADVACFLDDREVRGKGGESMDTALNAIGGVAFWPHVDLDVLATQEFAAVDYPQPGGLLWHDLDQLLAVALASQQIRGASIVIYNPDLDPDRSAAAA